MVEERTSSPRSALEKVLLAFPFWLARGGLQIRVQRVIVDPCQVGEQPVHGGGEVGAAGRDRLGDVGTWSSRRRRHTGTLAGAGRRRRIGVKRVVFLAAAAAAAP